VVARNFLKHNVPRASGDIPFFNLAKFSSKDAPDGLKKKKSSRQKNLNVVNQDLCHLHQAGTGCNPEA